MRVIGHRGCPALAPENTLAAFDAAAKRLDWVELDVRRCGSGELIVVHDETLDRVTGATGRVDETRLAELQALTVGGSDESIPTLAAVFDALPDRVSVNVELKETGLADDLAAVAGEAEHEILVSSFDADALREGRETTALPVAFLFAADWDESLSVAADLDCAAVHPHYDLLSSSRVEEAHDRGFEVNAWTVPDREVARRLREYGVDGVVVDDPGVAE
ncbi:MULTISPECIES: glycerophosphodiester phosphodiesterase family protein [unclassified Haloferax]|uniref:glycerophosphodiester phosphodiesterase n=1 Tax=unclassified Haloferax TaxID=2625095 RepID=UPI0002AFF7FB|nr:MULTISPECIES: glycerophosphodiester phosphodiesterase family protein [unclassified Haloferax]ELZ55551.1 glycerophosphodiester phosphodiesterase [Haloferax sp. ATCC BAA-646]ELZ66432.1 glycerophosphodiester phosphodiesterase [Haloferax sp. ATCC BAA-645]ELZ67936.1 glycerophosphodiester phosphodiesterase [Haloferax sp. ATCC BAA-644]